MMNKKGISMPILIVDIIGFLAIVIGAILIRYVSDPVISIIAGIVITLGVSLLSLMKYIIK